MAKIQYGTITFASLINKYVSMQAKVVSLVKSLSSNLSQTTPGKFLLVQFAMSQATQVGESISNLMQQVYAMIANSVRNQKGG